MIAGQSPRIKWRDNPHGKKRTLAEAKEIARAHGVHIADDVEFFEDEEGELPDNMTARGPRVTKLPGSLVYWSDLVNSITGRVPFIVRVDILKSDEAIVGVFGHEMYELDALRGMLKQGETTIETYIGLTCVGNPGNLHDEAWEHADDLVERMRKGG